mmetsp:Transcript_91025/g.190370  ORF Transcript_91025/g.190370 Transcript_91025/m.190370 type:complete len:139 (-) Transcript_91025:161-577(-)
MGLTAVGNSFAKMTLKPAPRTVGCRLPFATWQTSALRWVPQKRFTTTKHLILEGSRLSKHPAMPFNLHSVNLPITASALTSAPGDFNTSTKANSEKQSTVRELESKAGPLLDRHEMGAVCAIIFPSTTNCLVSSYQPH